MTALIVYPDGTDKPGVEFKTADGFVARVVSSIADDNVEDAIHACAILNDYFARTADKAKQPEGNHAAPSH